MIQETSFLGMPLRTQGQRRRLVVPYYAVLLLFSVIALVKTHENFGWLMPQILTLGGLLGGIRMGGPVKPYSEAATREAEANRFQSLNLADRKPFDDGTIFHPLDERERSNRDYAHYRAYRILMVTLSVACVAYWLSLNWTFAWFGLHGPVLAWILLVYVLSLPQSVLLWTEPEAPIDIETRDLATT
jgi:hypothetical protein